MTTAIYSQGTTPVQFREINWIRGALQTAIALEHSTMPLYSAAMYSLEVQNYPSYNAIRSVLMEEMLHMAAACNVLAALGGSPRIRQLDPRFPTQGLPGRVAPDLTAVLAPLSERQLQAFMRIEAPLFMLPRAAQNVAYPTIGRFYEAIRQAVVANAAAVRRAVAEGGPANQVGGNLGYRSIVPRRGVDPVEEILSAIDMITEQGEGAGPASIEAGELFQREASHYARFAELRYGRRYLTPPQAGQVSRETEPEWFQGEEITWPVVINTLAVPSDGYAAILAQDPNAAAVSQELKLFDSAYTAMLVALHDAWNGPAQQSWPSLGEAVIQMNEMRVISCFNILRYQVPEEVVARLPQLYPNEYRLMAAHTDLTKPVFYGPRFANLAV
jgi:Ferritin-like